MERISKLFTGALTLAAETRANSQMTINTVDYDKIAIGETVPITSSGQPAPINNTATPIDETSLDVNLKVATVFNEVVGLDYFYFFIDLVME